MNWTLFGKFSDVVNRVHLFLDCNTVITFDKALYCKPKELIWLRPDECRDIVLRLGSFHLIMNFLRAIGQYIEGSGKREVWTESLVYGEVTA